MLSRGTSNSLDTANDKLPLVPHTDSVADAKNDRSLTNLKLLELKDEKQTYFLGLGVSANIPRYLRGKGRIRNRCLSRKSCALLIRDIWSEKTKFDIEKKLQGKPSSLGHFLYLYLSKRFTSQGLIVEWGYNLTEACKLHKNYLTDCWVFLDILEEKLDESVYYHLVKVLEDFKTTLIKIDASINDGIASGIIPKTDLFLKLKEIWKYKTTKQIHELQTALDADQSGSKVTYRWMFQNEVESAFLEAIKMQEMEDRAKYLHDLETAILQYHSATMTALTSIEFSRIIGRFDVDKKKSDIDVYVARGFNNLVEKIKPRDAMTIAKFLANISKGVLYRG
ncbi:Translin-associated factor X-interacting protein 1 [Coelomomyces lativittatus]|nr:Translin-associated factor X-interacting protein 1 [Coelomomyces lativittatus]